MGKISTDTSRSSITVYSSSGDMLRVDALGGKLLLFLNAISVLSAVTRGDGKAGITHPCTPIFGPDTRALYKLAQHGDMRNIMCELTQPGENVIDVRHTIRDSGYPSGMQVRQTLSLDTNGFNLTFEHANYGTIQAPVNAAEHCYFDAPFGASGSFINGIDILKTIGEHITGVVIDLKKENLITIQGKPPLVLQQTGFTKAALWVGRNSETNSLDTDYVCIEPIEFDPELFGSETSMIFPGGKRTASLSISLG